MHPRKLESRILQAVNFANRDFNLLEEGDRILVAMSGGKDSYALMWALGRMQASLPQKFDIVAYHLDQGQPGHDVKPLERYMTTLGVPFEIEFQDTYTRVIAMTEPGKIYCAWCSRFRRAILYRAAKRHGCNKVALGHHRDDLVETFLLNAFFSGQLKSMPARLVSDKGREQIIRPLVYVGENDLKELAEHKEFPIMPCSLCGSQDKERKAIKRMLDELSVKHPRIRTSMLAALGNVRKTHLLDKSINPLHRGSEPVAMREGLGVNDDDGESDEDNEDASACDHSHTQSQNHDQGLGDDSDTDTALVQIGVRL